MKRFLTGAVLTTVFSTIWGLPQEMSVSCGSANLEIISNDLQLTTTDRTVIDWGSFSIDTHESVTFIQQDSSSAVLNRVIGAEPSQIMGKLISNGQCILINSNGVFFGKDSRVDVQSLIASAFDLHNDCYKEPQENWRFEGVGADVFHHGTIKAKDRVCLLGKKVGLFDHSSIEIPSGTVLIGGDYQGKNSNIPNADMVYFSPSSTISVDALESGNGGTIILWAEELNQAYGALSAKGGMLGGDGGLIEISSMSYLDFQGIANTSALSGKTGTLLFDPLDLTIAAANVNVSGPPAPFTLAFPTGAGAILRAADVTTSLNTNNVTIQTIGTPTAGPGNITITSPITIVNPLATNHTLTIIAAGGINVNHLISSTVAGTNVSLLALNGDINVNAAAATSGIRNTASPVGANLSVIAENGNVNLTAGIGRQAVIGTNNGNVFVSARRAANPAAGNISLLAASAGGNSFAIIGSPGQTAGAGVIRSGDITVEASGNITAQSGIGVLAFGQGSGIGKVWAFDGVPAGTPVTTNITVTAGQDISLICGMLANSTSIIGLIQAGTYNYTGDITVNAGRDLNLFTNANTSLIGTFSGTIITGHTAITNILLNVGRNLRVAGVTGGGLGGSAFIGTRGAPGPPLGATSITANIGGNTYFDARLNQTGFFSPAYGPVAVPTVNPTCFVNALGDFYILGSSDGGSNAAPTGFQTGLIDISRTDFTFHIWIGGSIRAFNNFSTLNIALVPSERVGPVRGPQNTSMRAGGDIILTSSGTSRSTLATASFGAPTFNGYFIEADSCFNIGELWVPQVAIVNGVNILAGTPVGANSPAIACDGVGAIAVDTSLYNLTALPTPYNGSIVPLVPVAGLIAPHTFTTTSPNIILHSGDTYTAATTTFYTMPSPSNMIIGSTLGLRNIIDINTTSGFIEIAGSDGPTFNGRSIGNLASCGCLNSFNDIAINVGTANPWTSNSIYVSANNNLNILTVPVVTSGASPVTLIADHDDSGLGNLNITQNITSAGGPILLDAGFGAPFGTSAILQTGGTVSSGGGSIQSQAVGNILVSGNATSFTSGVGNQFFQSTNGNILVDENILATTGNITLLTNIGNILVGTATGTGGSVQTTAGGNILLDAGNNIVLDGDPISLQSTTGEIFTIAENNTFVVQDVLTAGPITMITGNNMFLVGFANITSTGNFVDLVVDNDFPAAPLIGPGFFSMDGTAQINAAGTLRIYTALQALNIWGIGASINGIPFDPSGAPGTWSLGTLYEDSNQEAWCIYYPNGSLGVPFRIFYKDCLQQATQQAMIIVNEALVDLHPYNEFPGWVVSFSIEYAGFEEPIYNNEKYYFRRRQLKLLNHPKTYSQIVSGL